MHHQKIIHLRHQAADARALHEKAHVRPDDLDELLDLALAQIEGDEQGSVLAAGTDLDDLKAEEAWYGDPDEDEQ